MKKTIQLSTIVILVLAVAFSVFFLRRLYDDSIGMCYKLACAVSGVCLARPKPAAEISVHRLEWLME